MPVERRVRSDNFVIEKSALMGQTTECLRALAEIITPEIRKRLIKKLCNGKAADFDRLCGDIEPATTWAEAHQLIEEYFEQHAISPYLEFASQFTDLIYKRYFPKDGLS